MSSAPRADRPPATSSFTPPSRAPLSPPWKIRHGSTFLVPTALAACDRLRRLIAAMGVDYPRFRAILEARLVLDHRGTLGGQEGWMGTALLLALLFTWLSGLPVGLLSLAKISPGLWMSIVAFHATTMITLLLVVQYAPMIVDATDIAVVGSRPVPDRTVFAARIAHVAVYATAVAACCTFWPLALGWLGHPSPWLLVIVPLVVAASMACSLGLVALLFAVTLRIAGPAGFQRAAFLAQLAGAAVLMGGLQFLMPLVAREDLRAWVSGNSWWRALVPPLQQGSLFALVRGDTSTYTIVLSLLALATPLVLAFVAFRLASRHFVAGLSGEIVRAPRASVRWPAGLGTRLARGLTRPGLEHAGYEFVRALSKRDKVFLRSSIPMLVSFGVMSFASIAPLAGQSIVPRFVLALPIYLMLVGLPGMLETVRFTERPDAAWVLRAAPVASWRAFAVGGTKSLFAGYVVPLLVVMGTLAAVLSRGEALLHVAAAMLVTAGVTLGCARPFRHGIPFWREPKMGELDFSNLPVMVGSIAGSAVLAGVHAVLQLAVGPFGVAAWAACGLAACWIGWRGLWRMGEPTWR